MKLKSDTTSMGDLILLITLSLVAVLSRLYSEVLQHHTNKRQE
jgi:hypothetical protein